MWKESVVRAVENAITGRYMEQLKNNRANVWPRHDPGTQAGGNLTMLHACTSLTPMKFRGQNNKRQLRHCCSNKAVFPATKHASVTLATRKQLTTISCYACVLACEPLQFCGNGGFPVLRMSQSAFTEY
jgi:hypothetical protein